VFVFAHCSAALLEQPVVLEEGQKREKKKVQRFELTPQEVKKRKQPSLEEGSGTKLGDIPNVNYQLNKSPIEDVKPLYRLLFDTVPPSVSSFSRLIIIIVVIAAKTLICYLQSFWDVWNMAAVDSS